MSNYSVLKQDINNNIYENQTQQITGTVLNAILNEMTASLGAGYQFAGVATLGMNPGDPDQRVFYLAGEGIYTSFGGIQVPAGKLGVLKWDNRWTLQTIDGLGGGGANLTGYVSVASTDDLPDEGQPTIGYLCGTNLYLYVGEGGDTKEGKYQDCGSFRGPQGDSVQDVEQTQTSLENGGVNKIKFTLSNGISCEFQVRNGTTSSGLFPTLAALQAAYPSPVVGQYAFVGAGFPADIYVCTTAGTWTDSGEDYDGDNVDLTDYATKAELNQLEAKVSDLEDETSIMFSVTPNVSSIDWQQNNANSQLVSIGATLKKGVPYKMAIKFTGFSAANLGKLSSITFYLQSGTQVGGDFQTSDYFGYRSDFKDEEWHYIFYVPTEDIKYIRVIFLSSYSADDPVGSVYFKADEWAENYVRKSEFANEIVDIQSEISSLNSSVSEINVEIDGVPESVFNLSSYTQNRGTANNNGTWSSYGSSKYKHIAIPVTVGTKIEIVAGNTYRARYGFLSQYSAPNANNTTVHFAPDCVCETIDINETADMVVPSGAAYMYVETLQNDIDCTPASITDLGEKSKVESLQYAFPVDFNAYDNTIISSAYSYKHGWYIVSATGKWNSGSGYGGINLPVYDAQKMMVKGSSYTLAFLKSKEMTINSVAPFCRGFHGVITGTEDKMFDIPADCKFVYFLRLINDEDVLPDSCTLYFEKTEAVQKRRPIVSFVDDDARKAQLEWLEPIVKATGVPINIALITTAVGATNYCTWEELRRFRNIGFKFVAHGATNITTMDVEDVEAMFISTQSAMESHAMLDSDMFVLPNGAINETTRPVVENYFKCAYSTNPKVNVVPLSDKYLIRRISIDSGANSLSSWKQWVDNAIKTRGWVIFYGHADGENYDEAMRTAYIELINYCKSNGVAILSLPDAWKECSLLTAND